MTDRRRQARGYPQRWHALNKGADALATQGALTHIEDPGLLAVRAWKIQVARAQWRMLLDIYKAGRVHKQVRAEAGLTQRHAKEGP